VRIDVAEDYLEAKGSALMTAHGAPARFPIRPSARAALLFVLLLSALPSAASASAAPARTNTRLSPPTSRLNRPDAVAPYICGHLSVGGTFSHDQGLPGYGGSIIFRPPSSADFLDFLAAWNTGLVLQADWLSLGDGGRVLSADLILRRYFDERGGNRTSVMPFVGGGFGASSAWPGRGGSQPGLKYWSLLLEGGQEWRFARGYLLLVKGQLRVLRQGGRDWSTWSVLAGVGLPFPW
jgi:hypothetical protein